MALLPFDGLGHWHVPQPSHTLSLAPDQVTSQVGERLERQVKQAAPEVQLLTLAAQLERRRGQQ